MDPRLTAELAENKIPVVFYDVGMPKQNITNIRVDYGRGIEKAVDYLHDLGHRRMAFVSHHATLSPLSVREKAFRDTVAHYAPEVEWTSVMNVDGLEGGRLAARELLDSGFNPTAIVCVNDFMAMGVLRELRERRLRVPEDVSVTGFDNVKLSEYCYPPLTTLHIPRDKIGHLVFQALVPQMPNSRPAGGEIVIDPEFVLRDSTGPAQAALETTVERNQASV
jgi:LacI family transcriptional regulator